MRATSAMFFPKGSNLASGPETTMMDKWLRDVTLRRDLPYGETNLDMEMKEWKPMVFSPVRVEGPLGLLATAIKVTIDIYNRDSPVPKQAPRRPSWRTGARSARSTMVVALG